MQTENTSNSLIETVTPPPVSGFVSPPSPQEGDEWLRALVRHQSEEMSLLQAEIALLRLGIERALQQPRRRFAEDIGKVGLIADPHGVTPMRAMTRAEMRDAWRRERERRERHARQWRRT